MFDRLSALKAMFPGALRAAAPVIARRWRRAVATDPDLARDLIGMGLMVAMQPRDDAGATDLTPQRLAYDAGRRDLALELLALAGAGPDDIRNLMEPENARRYRSSDDA